ncbi:MAG: hypothetical protein LBC96_02135 [Lachnospiraceae bacterium]|jgi:hypothetical protein|nr:hypothetical protein [Lachnospiraceae bacterium]
MSNQKNKNITNSPNLEHISHYEKGRAYLKDGFWKSRDKFIELAGNSKVESRAAAAILALRTTMAGAASYGKAVYHYGVGVGKGVISTASFQNPNDGRSLDQLKIKMALAEGKKQNTASATKSINTLKQSGNRKQTSTSYPKKTINKGIESYRTRANTSKSTPVGIQSSKAMKSAYTNKSANTSSPKGQAKSSGQRR